MKTRKSLILISLLLCLVLVLSSCGSQEKTETANPTASAAGSTETGTEGTPGTAAETTESASQETAVPAVKADPRKITYWIPKTDDAKYYAEYEENPVIQYIRANYEFNGAPLDIDFVAAPVGSEQDNFNVLIGTGEYCGVMDLSMNGGTSPSSLFEEGILLDLTDLYKEHMPNYCAFLEAHPELEKEIYTIVDGQKKVVTLFTFNVKEDDPFEGFLYRRDWIARYGKNPVTGEAFTYGFKDPDNYESWYDDIVFPSGETEPVYISDWEWMFGIFRTAIEEQGIQGGYCYAPYYLGYLETGDISSGFGGIGVGFSLHDGKVVDGFTSDSARAYLQCMNTWYKNGWIDPSFAEHTNDMFYAIDVEAVYQGKVGLWQGRPSATGIQLDSGSGYTGGAMVFGCRQPINDVYGDDALKGVAPNRYMRTSQVGTPVGLTNKLKPDEVIAFLEFVDFLYTEEGANLRNFGLNQAQYESFGSELYDRLGISGGNYTVDENGTVHCFFQSSDPSSIAVTMGRTIGLTDNVMLDRQYDRYVADAENAWAFYPNSASLRDYVINAVPADQQKKITKLKANLDHFLAKTIPTVIKGNSTYNIDDDASWAQFVKDAQKYGTTQITEIYQQAYDLLNQ